MPRFLDAHGQHLWQAFMTSREQAASATLTLQQPALAMRRGRCVVLAGRNGPDPILRA